MFQSKSESNRIINDPVPKNASKFPIHQTYLTSDAERTGTGGYKFKAPEVWSSARSGKKSIAIRSIQPIIQRQEISFTVVVSQFSGELVNTFEYFDFKFIADRENSLVDLIKQLKNDFEQWKQDVSNDEDSELITSEFELDIQYLNNTLTFTIITESDSIYTYKISIVERDGDTVSPAESLNRFINQPLDDSKHTPSTKIVYDNVWDHSSTLYFHASFIPFDNYQFLGELRDEWNNPIIFQDPNTSPLFNVWITSDLKTPFPILHENFIIRMSFIISSNDFYD